jgi:hypothetical protein
MKTSNTRKNSSKRAVLGATLSWAVLLNPLGGCAGPDDAPLQALPAPEEHPGREELVPPRVLAPDNADSPELLSGVPFPEDGELEEEASVTAPGDWTVMASPSCNPADLSLTRWPLDGVNGQAWMINNYVDLDSTTSLKDYLGYTGSLARTYDEHRGIDIDIPSFREMDSGSAVVRAAAPGTVIEVVDNQFDRNTSCTGSANIVRVQHTNGFITRYLHLKKGSAAVAVGNTVVAGQVLGVAGSSGCSTAPHLHFEVRDCSNTAVEPFAAGMWTSPPTYAPVSNVMDVMLRKSSFTSSTQIKDPLSNPTLFKPGEPLGIGLSMAGRGGDVVALSLTAPDSAVESWTWTATGSSRYSHKYPYWNRTVGSKPGTWTLQVRINGTLRATRTFNVSNYPAGASEVSKHAVSSSSYQDLYDDASAAGYTPAWFDAYDDAGQTFFNVVFHPKDSYGRASRHGLSASAYQTEMDSLVSQGYRPFQVESYLSNGSVRYAALFTRKSGSSWVTYHGKTDSEHQSLFNTYTASGYRLVNASVVSVGGVRYTTALYDKDSVGGWVAKSAIPASQYQTEFDAQNAAGRYLKYLNPYVHSGSVYYSAIWDSKSYGSWAARHDRTSAQYQSEYDYWTGSGYDTYFVAGHALGGAHRFAGVWTR